MAEDDEFAEALLDQIRVETDEEREIIEAADRAREDGTAAFDGPDRLVEEFIHDIRNWVAEFTGMRPPDIPVRCPGLDELKEIKGKSVFTDSRDFVDRLFLALAKQDRDAIAGLIRKDAAKYLAYSAYAKSYVSKITTTYGSYTGSEICLNGFILSRYPQIMLHKNMQGRKNIESGYRGAVKNTLLEETVHSIQDGIYKTNAEAVTKVNRIVEGLAKTILELDDRDASRLGEHMQMQPVPPEFPMALRANLFFVLHPESFILENFGDASLTYTNIAVDPGITEIVPRLQGIYEEWLPHIQRHFAAYAAMDGMAAFCAKEILRDDPDVAQYKVMLAAKDTSIYGSCRDMGERFVSEVYEARKGGAFGAIMSNPPGMAEIKNPAKFQG